MTRKTYDRRRRLFHEACQPLHWKRRRRPFLKHAGVYFFIKTRRHVFLIKTCWRLFFIRTCRRLFFIRTCRRVFLIKTCPRVFCVKTRGRPYFSSKHVSLLFFKKGVENTSASIFIIMFPGVYFYEKDLDISKDLTISKGTNERRYPVCQPQFVIELPDRKVLASKAERSGKRREGPKHVPFRFAMFEQALFLSKEG